MHRSHLLVDTIRAGIAALFVAFQVWILFEPQQPMLERPAHLIFALALVFLWSPLGPGFARRTIDALILAAVAATGIYYWMSYGRLTTRMENVSPVFDVDIVFGALLVILLLEGVRRTVGWILVTVISVFLVYAFVGPWMPGWLGFRGFPVDDAIEILTMTTTGILGITTSTSAQFVFYFITFGVIYSGVGGGRLFIDLALRVAGRTTGGAPKASILSSGMMGTISGSAVANVASTGVFTIPLMRRSGLSRDRAAATEAVASTGGQLMPPIMGVAAFVMAELLATPYGQIALAGLIPALAFYCAILLVADLRARRSGEGTVRDEIQDIAPILPRIHLLAPPIILIGCLIAGWSAPYSAVIATASCFVVAFVRRSGFLGPLDVVRMVRDAGRQAAEVAVPIAAIGIIIAVAVQSNLALKFSGTLIDAAGGNLYLSLAVVLLGCIIMGMGLPTVAAYIIGAVLYVPALRDLGIEPLSAHFFIFYYCVLSMITPPVALASYAAAGVAGGHAMRTSMEAFGISLVAFFIPFAFVFDDTLLFQGSAGQIAVAGIGMLTATALWAVALAGYLFRPLSMPERLVAAAISMVGIFSPTASMNWSLALGGAALVLIWCYATRTRMALSLGAGAGE